MLTLGKEPKLFHKQENEMFKWSLTREEWGKNRVFTLHVSKTSKYHSHPTRSIFLFPIPPVIPRGNIVYPKVGERQGEDKGKRMDGLLAINASIC